MEDSAMFFNVGFDEPMTNLMSEILTRELVSTTSQPAIDVVEDENESSVVAELPGVKKEDVKISVEDGILTIKGVRKQEEIAGITRVLHSEIEHEPFSRSINLPHPVAIARISAELTNGILKISLPKAEKIRPRTIEIKQR